MVIFPIHRYRLLDDPFDRFFGDQLDFFDPWYDFDVLTSLLPVKSSTFRWVTAPYRLTHSPKNKSQDAKRSKSSLSDRSSAEKFRVQLNVAGFDPETIKTKVEGDKVIVEAKQEDRQPDGDYSLRKLRKSYNLPAHADAEHLASYVTPNQILVIEVPIRNPEIESRRAQAENTNQNLIQFGQHRDPSFDYVGFLSGSDFRPRLVDKGNDKKQLELSIGMKDYRPEEIKVSVKNNELIVQGEHSHKDKTRSERIFFFKSTTLPPGTQVDQLQSYLTDDGHLKIEAPFVEPKEPAKPIDNKQK